MKPIFFFLFCLLLTGCQCLPSGDPPPGDIVGNPPSAVQSIEAAENRLVTSLSAYLLQHPPADGGITVEPDAATAISTYRVMRGVRSISGVMMQPGSSWVLRTRGEGNLWLFQLFDRSRTVVLWQERVAVAGEGTSHE